MEGLKIDSRVALEPTAHEEIEFVHFGLDGFEMVRSGYIWAQAPTVKGMRCFWVLPAQADAGPARRPKVGNLAVAVARASRRHRVGLETQHAQRLRWIPRAGRYVDVGTFYTETHPGSPTGALTFNQRSLKVSPPTRIVVPPLAPWEFALLSGERDPLLLQ